MTISFNPVERTSEFLAAFQRDGEDMRPLVGDTGNAGLQSRAARTAKLWRDLSFCSNAVMLRARSDDDLSIASKHGATIIEARKSLNLGLLRATLKKIDPVEEVAFAQADRETAVSAERTVWQLVKRLGRIETSRVIELSAGDAEYVIHAHKGEFQIIDDPEGVTGMTSAIFAAVSQGQAVEFTFGTSVPDGQVTNHKVADFFTPSSDEWVLSKDGWIIACPAKADIDQMGHAVAIGQALASWSESKADEMVELISNDEKPIFRAKRQENGDIILSLT